MTELQIRWGNPIGDTDWDCIKEWDDAELDKSIAETIGQLRFEKALPVAKWIIIGPVILFVILGIIGLLLFGIRQLL